MAGVFWLRTREVNSRLFFKLKFFYLILFSILWSFILLLLFFKLKNFLYFNFTENLNLLVLSLLLMGTALFKLFLSKLFEELIFIIIFCHQGFFIYQLSTLVDILNQDISIIRTLFHQLLFYYLPQFVFLYLMLVVG